MHLKRSGFGLMEMIIGVGICVFLILPVSAYLLDKSVVFVKAGQIRDSVDMANLSLYNTMDIEYISSCAVSFNQDALIPAYKTILSRNLRLDGDMNPLNGSLADGTVRIVSLSVYLSGFPSECPNGTILERPAIHSVVAVPVKPSFYSSLIKDIAGIGTFELTIHTDTDLPVDN